MWAPALQHHQRYPCGVPFPLPKTHPHLGLLNSVTMASATRHSFRRAARGGQHRGVDASAKPPDSQCPGPSPRRLMSKLSLPEGRSLKFPSSFRVGFWGVGQAQGRDQLMSKTCCPLACLHTPEPRGSPRVAKPAQWGWWTGSRALPGSRFQGSLEHCVHEEGAFHSPECTPRAVAPPGTPPLV